MNPLLLLALSSSGLSLLQTGWNFAAGQSQIDAASADLAKKKEFADTERKLQLTQTETQYNKGLQDVNQQASAAAVDAAGRGVIGVSSEMQTQGQKQTSLFNLDGWRTSAMGAIDLNYSKAQWDIQQQSDQIDSARWQNWANLGLGLAGAGVNFLSKSFNPNTGAFAWDSKPAPASKGMSSIFNGYNPTAGN